ncbi:MAG: regulator SirB [Gammaproteobacteria bacterium]|nr:MAG: regulator SirB [Gammaproteobacteria bacterium]
MSSDVFNNKMYLTVKTLHLTLIALSFIIFLSRGIMMMKKTDLYRHRVFRIIPPLIDTLLLASGITLMVILEQYPTTQAWIAVKLGALIVYIILGVIALNRANNYRLQLISFIAAISTIAFMYSVARAHHPLGIFYLLVN